ncbi:MAG TPA: hypothetical protein VMT24_09425 [Aggregatilineaceae bacterium]|nr:hypothetical protein [Aggregatilineaceae bacterium]
MLVDDLEVIACADKKVWASTNAAYATIHRYVGPSAPYANNTADQRAAGSHH